MGNKKIALVTGASSGMGKEFVLQIQERYPQIEEIWALARNKKALEMLKKKVPNLRVCSLNLICLEELKRFQNLLEREKPQIEILVNCAGVGIQKQVEETTVEELWNTTQLNCSAFTAVLKICFPYCRRKSRILCLSSGAAFIPQPGFAAYAASKSYVLSFSRALRKEWRNKAVITIVCPGPVDTPFLEKMGGKEHMPAYKKWFLARPEAVVKKALKDSERGKELSVYGYSVKVLRVVCKILPHGLILKFL